MKIMQLRSYQTQNQQTFGMSEPKNFKKVVQSGARDTFVKSGNFEILGDEDFKILERLIPDNFRAKFNRSEYVAQRQTLVKCDDDTVPNMHIEVKQVPVKKYSREKRTQIMLVSVHPASGAKVKVEFKFDPNNSMKSTDKLINTMIASCKKINETPKFVEYANKNGVKLFKDYFNGGEETLWGELD